MSIEASILVCIISIFRFVFKKAPKWITCALWGLAGLKLILPFSLESIVGLLPSKSAVGLTSDGTALTFSDDRVQQAVDGVITPAVGSLAPASAASVDSGQLLLVILCRVWIVGFAAMVLFAVISYIRLYVKVSASVRSGRVYLCDNIDTPFILGFFRPKIYVPSFLDESKLGAITAHENAHIRRKDHWWKPLGYLILSVYWFNPLIWLAYILLCRDIELACDEKVIKDMSAEGIADYSQTLLDCSKPVRMVTACPVAFGETGVKQRIKSALSYKKPALWIIIAALIASAVVAVCFTTSRRQKDTVDIQVLATDKGGELYCFDVTEDGKVKKKKADTVLGSYNGLDASPDCFTFRSVNSSRDSVSVNKIEFVSPAGDVIEMEITGDYQNLFKAVESDTMHAFDKLTVFESYEGAADYIVAIRRDASTEILRFNPTLKALNTLCTIEGYTVQDIAFCAPVYDGDSSADTQFIAPQDVEETMLEAINQCYLDTYGYDEGLGYECKAGGYVVFGVEETDREKTIYSYISYACFGFESGHFIEKSGGSNPLVVTVNKADGSFSCSQPRDGSYYGDDIKKMFPRKYRERAINPTENEMQIIWNMLSEQAQEYLDSIGRSADICTYGDIRHILLVDFGIDESITDIINKRSSYFLWEIGNQEIIEDGVRYVYQTEYDKGTGVIRYVKFNYNTNEVALYIEVNSETGDIVSMASKPGYVPEHYVAERDHGENDEYTTVVYTDRGESTTASRIVRTTTAPETESQTTGAPVSDPTKPVSEVYPTVGHPTIITDVFIVKEVHGTTLILARYDRYNGEYKEGLYSADLSNLDGSADMKFTVGEVLTVRYDYDLKETYPYGMTVREIYPAVWN